MLRFYADRLGEADRYLLAALSMFARPVPAAAVLTVAGHPRSAAAWRVDAGDGGTAVRDRLGGLVSWHPDGTLSAHPLVRDAFRSLALAAAGPPPRPP